MNYYGCWDQCREYSNEIAHTHAPNSSSEINANLVIIEPKNKFNLRIGDKKKKQQVIIFRKMESKYSFSFVRLFVRSFAIFYKKNYTHSNTHAHNHPQNFVAFYMNRINRRQWWHFIDFLFAVVFFRLIIRKVWNKVKTHTQWANQSILVFVHSVYLLCAFECVCLYLVDYLFERTHFRFINHWFVLPIWCFAQIQTHFSKNGQQQPLRLW